MVADQKLVSQLPVEEIWAGRRLMSTIKVRDLEASDIAELLRSDVVRFVVADIGKPFECGMEWLSRCFLAAQVES